MPAEMRTGIVMHARWCHPAEACGLIAVDPVRRLQMAYPLTNAEASPYRFTIEAHEHFGAVRHAEAQGWEIGGVFHSHPSGPATMSVADLGQPHDPDWFHLVVGLKPSLHLRAWRIVDGVAVESTLLATD